ncbi:MAG TPA: cache domain-containing protein [Nitrospiria bacterium]|nr:cache domain-containing protein [Nitrospiria bacterium]
MRSKLQNKLILSILVVGIISTILGLGLVYFFGKSTIKRIIGSSFQEIAEVTSKRLESLIDHHIEESGFLASSREVQTLLAKTDKKAPDSDVNFKTGQKWQQLNENDPQVNAIIHNEVSDYFRRFQEKDTSGEGIHYFIFVADKSGIVRASNRKTPNFNYSNEKWFQTTIKLPAKGVYLSDILFEPAIKAYVFTIAMPIYKNGEVIGALSMVHNVDLFFRWVTSVKVGKKDHTMLASSDGSILFCPIFPIRTHKITEDLQKQIFKSEAGWDTSLHDVHYPGREALNGFAPLDITLNSGPDNFGGKKWYIFTSQDPYETFQPVFSLLKLILLAGLSGVALLSLLSWLEARRIVRPIKVLQNGIHFIGNGRLDYRINVRTGDEVEEVAHEFNEMARKMESLYQGMELKVSERTRELETRTRELELRNNEMYTLLAMGAALNECRTREEILTVTPNKVLGMMKADGILISFNLPSGEAMMKSLPTSVFKNEEVKALQGRIFRVIFEKPEPFVLENLHGERQAGIFPIPAGFDFTSLAAVPLFSKRKVIGMMVLLFKKPHTISAQEEELLTSMGHQIGNAFENVREDSAVQRGRE